MPPVRLIPAHGGFGLRGPDELLDLFERKGRNRVRPFVYWADDRSGGRHAATSTDTRADCFTSQSVACCALDAAVKIARLSAFSTRSQDWMYCAWSSRGS